MEVVPEAAWVETDVAGESWHRCHRCHRRHRCHRCSRDASMPSSPFARDSDEPQPRVACIAGREVHVCRPCADRGCADAVLRQARAASPVTSLHTSACCPPSHPATGSWCTTSGLTTTRPSPSTCWPRAAPVRRPRAGPTATRPSPFTCHSRAADAANASATLIPVACELRPHPRPHHGAGCLTVHGCCSYYHSYYLSCCHYYSRAASRLPPSHVVARYNCRQAPPLLGFSHKGGVVEFGNLQERETVADTLRFFD